MLAIDDPKLPGLADLSEARLYKLTSTNSVTLMRLRYREGKRAILHLATGEGAEQREGALWFFGGDKARRLARRNKSAHYDPDTQALYECFPDDHRMPQIRAFLEAYTDIAPALTGAEPDDEPVLLRYRPGLSCTFRCTVKNRPAVYVKQINDDSALRIAAMNRQMCELLRNVPVAVAAVKAMHTEYTAVVYAAAPGLSLDQSLMDTGNLDTLHQTIQALRHFWQLPLLPERQMTPQMLRHRATESAAFVSVTAPSCMMAVNRIVKRLQANDPQLILAPIHGDMKLEHVFLDGDKTTLIDTESVSFGPPDYDLAQLYGRLWQAEMEDLLPRTLVASATDELRHAAGPGFNWCLDIVALRLAKFYAQRPAPDMVARINGMLERLA